MRLVSAGEECCGCLSSDSICQVLVGVEKWGIWDFFMWKRNLEFRSEVSGGVRLAEKSRGIISFFSCIHTNGIISPFPFYYLSLSILLSPKTKFYNQADVKFPISARVIGFLMVGIKAAT